MTRWQNPRALKRVKNEVEACVAKLGGVLEAVINTPVDDHKNLLPLTAAATQFAQVPGTLRMLQFAHLALLASEIQALLLDTLRTDVELDSRDLDLRLESAFVAVTDLPALLEHALRESADSFELVFRLVNRLRKARECAVIFSPYALLKNADVNFRRQFGTQAEKMTALLSKQVEGLHKASAVLVKNPGDRRALQVVATVLDNLELMLRDHRIGTLWGLARALIEVHESGECDQAEAANFFHSLVPHAQRLLTSADELQAGIDEALLERLVNLVGGASAVRGRPAIVKLWYNLNPASGRGFRADYRNILVRYYNKGAFAKCLTLVSDDCKRMLDAINELAEAADISRDKTREIWQAIGKLREVLCMLGLSWLSDLIAARLPATPGEKLGEALTVAARLLFRVSNELEQKLEKMERELFNHEAMPGAADSGNGNRARVMQAAIQMLEAVTVAFDEHMANATGADGVGDKETPNDSPHLRLVHEKLDTVTNVLDTLGCTEQSRHLALARDYVAWLLKTGVRVDLTPPAAAAAAGADDHPRMLAHLVICSLRNLEQLLFGREDAAAQSMQLVTLHAQALRAFLDREAPVAAPARLVLVPSSDDEDTEAPAIHDDAPSAADEDVAAIFAEEFDEVLAQLREDHAALMRDSTLVATATYCRRHFHTLKGSGRMAGADRISRLADSMEKAFDLGCERGIDTALLELTSRALELLPALKRAFRTGDGVIESPDAVEALCTDARAWISPNTAGSVQAKAVANPVEQAVPVEASAAAEPVDQTLLAVFLDEADELLQAMDKLYLQWRTTPFDKSCVDEYLRLLHTVKGSSALVGEHELSASAHEYESFIIDMRQRNIAFDEAFFVACDTKLHALHDICRQYQRNEAGQLVKLAAAARSVPVEAATESSNSESRSTGSLSTVPQHAEPQPAEAQYAELQITATQLVEPQKSEWRSTGLQSSTAQNVAAQNAPPQNAPAHNVSARQPAAFLQQEMPATDAPPPDEHIRVSSQLLKSLLNDADEVSFSRSRVETAFQEVSALLLDMDTALNRFKSCVKALDDRAGQPPAQLARTEARDGARERNAEFDALEMDRYTELQEMAVSLSENYNDLQDIRGSLGVKARDIAHVLDGQQRLTNSMQDGLILTQMVPFASVVPRLSRLVRQIGTTLQKPARLEVTNQQGSLDRNILQAIITPLEHIVRNAIDHGIEPGATRRQQGKPDEATLHITVARRGASFRIEIRDDGQGIDVDKVRQQAIRKELLREDAVISDQEAYQLLFRNGFSTAATVSSISGRGVGLDVVKSEIEQIGGTVEIESTRGVGTALILNLPLTSSLNRALVFAVQETRYAVLMNTLDGVLVEKLATVHQKQQQEGKPVFDYVGKRYEYLYLGKLIDPAFKPRLDSIDSPISLLLVSGTAANYALHIDAIVESRDLVVKSLGQQFASMPGIAGGVILPDGNVAIVLDLKSMLGQHAKDQPALDMPLTLTPMKNAADKTRKLVMVVDDSVTVRKVTSAMLKRNGMDVITARNGLEAVELLESNLPDLILLDIEMPRMDGFEVASFVRAQESPISDIPIIMITSRIGEKHRNRAEAIGINEYLCKPFKEDSLMQSIQSY